MSCVLPEDCIFNIFKFNTPYDLCVLCQVCKVWHNIAENDILWRHHCQQRWQLWDSTSFQSPFKKVYEIRFVKDQEAISLANQCSNSLNPVLQRQSIKDINSKGLEVFETLVQYINSLPENKHLTLKYHTRKALCTLSIPLLKRQLDEMYRDQFNFEDAAILVAKSTDPLLDIKSSVCDVLDGMAAEVQERLKASGNRVSEKINTVVEYLFNELGFEGNTSTYYDPRNSMINQVLRRRKGMPITLCVIFEAVCRRVNIDNIEMTGMPMNFMCKYLDPDTDDEVFLDLFRAGISMSRDDCIEMMTQIQVEHPQSPEHLKAVGSDHVLSRMLINTINCYLRSASQVIDMIAPMDLYIYINRSHVLPGQRLLRVEALLAAEEPDAALEELNSIYEEVRHPNTIRIGETLRNRALEMKQQFDEQANSRDPLTQFPVKKRTEESNIKHHVGQIMRHRIYPYKGVIYGWDEKCKASLAWRQQMGVATAEEPFYNVYVDMDDRYYQCTYVAERNITIESPGPHAGPVNHPNIGEHFDEYDPERNVYIPNLLTQHMYPQH